MDFVHLHLHTEFSLLDGAIRIEKLFERVYELGQRAVAITDHGNMFGVLEFFKAAAKFSNIDPYNVKDSDVWKVKPIIGCEVYVADDHKSKQSVNQKQPKLAHLILLAKNNVGYHNLIKLVSLGYVEGYYYKPRIDFELLSQYSEGLVCLSACLSGILSQQILGGQIDKARQEASRYQALFGDDYYIELQDHGIEQQKQVLPHLIAIANQLSISLVATNDAHYLNCEDAEMQRVLQSISFRTTVNQLDDVFATDQFYVKSAKEMLECIGIPEALHNTVVIADKCECGFFFKQQLLPKFSPNNGMPTDEYFRQTTYQGLLKITGQQGLTKLQDDRLRYEVDTIIKLKFVDYFLIVWDFIAYAEQNGIAVGPGRGSGAGSIVAYALGITKIDPLKHGLLFERFLNSERVSNPDFDIDFCVRRRDDVIKYVFDKYGESNVAQITTFGTLAAKGAIKDCGRVLGYTYSEVDAITKTMPRIVLPKVKIEDMLVQDKLDKEGRVYRNDLFIQDFEQMYQNSDVSKRVVDMAIKVEGMPRQTGIHAAGVVICKDELSRHIPIMRTADGIVATQFDMTECEELGLLKMDFLGLNTLTDIDVAVGIIKKNKGVDIDFYSMEYDDPGVYDMIGQGDTHGVFQLESVGMKRFMRELRPTNLEDIIAGIALYRPGPMDFIDEYVAGKRNPEGVRYDHTILKNILEVTYGVIVYQEQVMQIVRDLAGYTLGRADIVRRIMSKKKKEEMDTEIEIFLHGTQDGAIKGAIASGVQKDAALRVFEKMTSFANYAFNKSHAAAYGYLSYQTAYLKYHYPLEFLVSILNNRITKIEEVANYLRYINEKGIRLLSPNINTSDTHFVVENGSIRMGMSAIKNVGVGFIDNIISDRDAHGAYTDFEDFVYRLSGEGLNKRNIEAMIQTGCFDDLGVNRRRLMASFEKIMQRAVVDKKAAEIGQLNMFDDFVAKELAFVYPDLPDYSLREKLYLEKEAAGIYLTGHPLDEYREILKNYAVNSVAFAIDSAAAIDEGQDENTVSTAESKANSAEPNGGYSQQILPAEKHHISKAERGQLRDGEEIVIAGLLSVADRHFTKASKEMGIGKLEDLYGSIEVLISPSNMAKLKPLWILDSVVEIRGRVGNREGSLNVWIQEIKPIVLTPQEQTVQTLQIILDRIDVIDEMKEILQYYSGDVPVVIVSSGLSQKLDFGVSLQDEAIFVELAGLLGRDKVNTI